MSCLDCYATGVGLYTANPWLSGGGTTVSFVNGATTCYYCGDSLSYITTVGGAVPGAPARIGIGIAVADATITYAEWIYNTFGGD